MIVVCFPTIFLRKFVDCVSWHYILVYSLLLVFGAFDDFLLEDTV